MSPRENESTPGVFAGTVRPCGSLLAAPRHWNGPGFHQAHPESRPGGEAKRRGGGRGLGGAQLYANTGSAPRPAPRSWRARPPRRVPRAGGVGAGSGEAELAGKREKHLWEESGYKGSSANVIMLK